MDLQASLTHPVTMYLLGREHLHGFPRFRPLMPGLPGQEAAAQVATLLTLQEVMVAAAAS
jgi:hypothetical protein